MKILIQQKEEILEAQRGSIEAALSELGGGELAFASSPAEAARHSDADILITPTLPWLDEALRKLPRVEWIHFLSAGVDPIWEMAVDWTKYRLSKSVGVHASTISEYALAAILYVLKGFGRFAAQQQRREWNRFWLDECNGKTLGIVGIGTIGRQLARQASNLGMRVIGTVNTPRDIDFVDQVYPPSSLNDVLRSSDFVVLLAPLVPETRLMIGRAQFNAMKSDAWLINVARGEIVDENALIHALQDGLIGGAVLDVFEEEPLPLSSPLWEMQNVLITPHVAGTTQHYIEKALDVFRDNFLSYVSTGELVTPVLVERGY